MNDLVTKERLVAFTDAVLAIIMTILVLELDKPTELSFEGFWELRHDFFAYFLSFFYLGSMWISLNGIWESVRRVSRSVVWCSLILLFFSSLLPYATGIVSDNFGDRLAQAFYGAVLIAVTVCNLLLHKVVDKPNSDSDVLLKTTKTYRKLLRTDIIIKLIALVLALTVYPQSMMYGALFAAATLQLGKIVYWKKRKAENSAETLE